MCQVVTVKVCQVAVVHMQQSHMIMSCTIEDLWPPLANYSVAVKNENCEAVARKPLHTRGMHIRNDCMVAMVV